MVESPQALLARLDERTEAMADDISALRKAIDECVKPKLDSMDKHLGRHDTEIAVLRNNWKIMVGLTSAIVAFATWFIDHISGNIRT